MMTWISCFFQNLAIKSMVAVMVSMIAKKKIRFSGSSGFSKALSPMSSNGCAIRRDSRWITTNSPPIRTMGKMIPLFSSLSVISS